MAWPFKPRSSLTVTEATGSKWHGKMREKGVCAEAGDVVTLEIGRWRGAGPGCRQRRATGKCCR